MNFNLIAWYKRLTQEQDLLDARQVLTNWQAILMKNEKNPSSGLIPASKLLDSRWSLLNSRGEQ